MSLESSMDILAESVHAWGEAKNLIRNKNTHEPLHPAGQMNKLYEEVDELDTALAGTIDAEEAFDAIGDCMVVMTMILGRLNAMGYDECVSLEDCYDKAYNVIKNRIGKTVDGVFIKDN